MPKPFVVSESAVLTLCIAVAVMAVALAFVWVARDFVAQLNPFAVVP